MLLLINKIKDLNFQSAYDITFAKVLTWAEEFIKIMPNLIVAIFVMLLFFIVAKLLRRLAFRLGKRITNNLALIKLVATISFILVLSIGIFTSLSILHLDKALTSLLTGAGIIGLALSFAFQDSAANLISGFFLAVRKPLNIGDIVETNDIMGRVIEMSLRNTVVESFQGQHVFIPNKEVYQNKLVNYSSSGERRIDLEVGVGYGTDLKLAQKTAIDAINNLSFVKNSQQTSFVFGEFGSSSINGTLMFWLKYPGQKEFLDALSDAIIALKKAYDRENINIPFPIRTLDFRSGDLEKLKDISKPEGPAKAS